MIIARVAGKRLAFRWCENVGEHATKPLSQKACSAPTPETVTGIDPSDNGSAGLGQEARRGSNGVVPFMVRTATGSVATHLAEM